jgi:hypothetical protein
MTRRQIFSLFSFRSTGVNALRAELPAFRWACFSVKTICSPTDSYAPSFIFKFILNSSSEKSKLFVIFPIEKSKII